MDDGKACRLNSNWIAGQLRGEARCDKLTGVSQIECVVKDLFILFLGEGFYEKMIQLSYLAIKHNATA